MKRLECVHQIWRIEDALRSSLRIFNADFNCQLTRRFTSGGEAVFLLRFQRDFLISREKHKLTP